MAGRVTVNGEVVTLLGKCIDPASDLVAVDGIPVLRPATRTLMLNKPAGYISTCADPHARDTVMRLAPAIPGLHPIGRLDKETTGLLLLSNDGDLTYALTHPKHHVEKTYHARVAGVPDEAALERLRAGIQLEDGLTAPAQVRCVHSTPGGALVEMIIHEGRKRQVRRMLAAVGSPVLSLSRVQVGLLQLGDLPEGAWRELSAEEVEGLREAAGRERPPHAV